MRYIDVSEWQGAIDWEQAKPHIDGAIMRAGWGRGNPDRQFARNASECNRLGIPCGAYWFSYAKTEAEARAEAEHLLAAAAPYRMELPLCFDFEYDSVSSAAMQGVTVTKALASAMVRAFCERIEAGGCWALNYANPDFLSRYYDPDIPKRFGLWLAQWTGGDNAPDDPGSESPALPAPPRPCAIWQYSSRGAVPGVSGPVDLDLAYTDFAALIREKGLNGPEPGHSEPVRTPAWESASPVSPEAETDCRTGAAAPVRNDEGARGAAPALSAAVDWARENGLLPADAALSDPLTAAAAAEMFLNYHRAFRPGKEGAA